MKQESMKIGFLVIFAALTALFVVVAWPFAKSAFLAFTIAVIFFPLYRLANERLHLPRYIASIIVTLIVAICVILPLAVLVGVVVTKIGHFLQEIVAKVQSGSFEDTLMPLITWVQATIEKAIGQAPSASDIQGALINLFEEAGKKFYEFSPRVISTTVSLTANFFLMFIFLIVFFAEGSTLYSWFMEITPISDDYRRELSREVRLTITSSIVAALITAVFQGMLLGLGFWMAGFSQPHGWMLVAIILSVIPVVGALACYLTATAILMSSGNLQGAILFLLFGIVVISNIDNIIRPIVIRGTSRIHPLLLFVTILGAVKIMGPIGLLVGPVLLSIFLAALRIYRREYVAA